MAFLLLPGRHNQKTAQPNPMLRVEPAPPAPAQRQRPPAHPGPPPRPGCAAAAPGSVHRTRPALCSCHLGPRRCAAAPGWAAPRGWPGGVLGPEQSGTTPPAAGAAGTSAAVWVGVGIRADEVCQKVWCTSSRTGNGMTGSVQAVRLKLRENKCGATGGGLAHGFTDNRVNQSEPMFILQLAWSASLDACGLCSTHRKGR